MAMEHADLSPDLTIDQLFSRWHQVIPVFMRLRVPCVGCPISPFETLATVAKIYGLPLDNLMNELKTAIAAKTN
jgi:hybrid cluster-associated redox disulfide protein